MSSSDSHRAIDELFGLVERYDALEEVAVAAPGRTPRRRAQLRAVSERFPGALRELDAIGVDGVRARRAVVVALIEQVRAFGVTDSLAAPEHGWVRAALALAPRLRLVLGVKAWLVEHGVARGRAPADARARVRACYPDADDELLDRIASPPNGQVQQVAYQDAARALGIDVDELKRTLYGD